MSHTMHDAAQKSIGEERKSDPSVDIGLFKQAMRRLASGVSLVTTVAANERFGLVATSVSSVTAAPPTLLVCLNKSASCFEAFAQSRAFCVNLLTHEDEGLARTFARSDARDLRFKSDRWIEMNSGSPALEGSLASIDCETTGQVQVGSSTIFIGQIREIRTWGSEIYPLIYLDGSYLPAKSPLQPTP